MADYDEMAQRDHDAILAVLASGDAPRVTFAAESAGRYMPSVKIVGVLLELTRSSDSLIREGAIYGLGFHLDAPGVRERLDDMADADPSEAIRLAAAETRDD